MFPWCTCQQKVKCALRLKVLSSLSHCTKVHPKYIQQHSWGRLEQSRHRARVDTGCFLSVWNILAYHVKSFTICLFTNSCPYREQQGFISLGNPKSENFRIFSPHVNSDWCWSSACDVSFHKVACKASCEGEWVSDDVSFNDSEAVPLTGESGLIWTLKGSKEEAKGFGVSSIGWCNIQMHVISNTWISENF